MNISQTMTAMVQITTAIKWEVNMGFRIAYFYLTLDHCKIMVKVKVMHISTVNFIGICDRKHITIATKYERVYWLLIGISYLILTHSNFQGQGHTYIKWIFWKDDAQVTQQIFGIKWQIGQLLQPPANRNSNIGFILPYLELSF